MEKIDIDTLHNWLDDPDVFIMDVRNPGDWDASTRKIKHAHRFETYNFWDWANDLPRDKRLVLY